jgi:hypothetical protein
MNLSHQQFSLFIMMITVILSCSTGKKISAAKPTLTQAVKEKNNTEPPIEIKKHRMVLPSLMNTFRTSLCIAKWKDYYLISYFDKKEQTHLLKTRDFEKFEKLNVFNKTIIWDINTDAGQIAILSSPIPDERIYYDMFFKIMDEKGNIQKSTKLLGDVDVKKPLAYILDDSGNRQLSWLKNQYSAAFTIQHNWSDKISAPDVHQAHTEMFITKNGEILGNNIDWIASHTFELNSFVSENYKLKIAKGDAYPRGIFYEFRSKELEIDDEDPEEIYYSALFFKSGSPMKISGEIGENKVDLTLAEPIIDEEKQKIYIGGTTRDKRVSSDIFFIKENYMDEENKEETIWLTNTPKTEEHALRMFPYSKNSFLLLWSEYDMNLAKSLGEDWYDDILYDEEKEDVECLENLYPEIQKKQKTKAQLIDKEGNLLGKATTVDMNICMLYRDFTENNDRIYESLTDYEMELPESLVEENRLILPFYYPISREIIFYEIMRPGN